MPSFKPKILYIANGRSKKLPRIEKQLQKPSEFETTFMKTKKAGDAYEFALENCNEYSHIISVGGDGTIHEIVNGVLDGIGKSPGPILGIIPTGSGNDFYKTLNSPKDIAPLLDLIRENKIIHCDVGTLTLSDSNGGMKYFINIADVGIGAMVVEEVNRTVNKFNTNITFFRAIVSSFRRYNNINVTCTGDDWQWSGKIKFAVAANGKYFGSGLMIAPDASLTSGSLAVTIGADISTMDYILNLPQLKRGKKINHPQVEYRQTKKLTITSTEKCGVEADGELLGNGPVEIGILPGRLRILSSGAYSL